MAGMNIYEVFKTNERAENEGLWFGYGPGPSGKEQRFLLARMGRSNKGYTAAVQRMHDEYGAQMNAGTLAEETAFNLMLEIFVGHVLLSWDGICGRDGEEIPFTRDAAKQLLIDLPDLYQELQSHAAKREHFLETRKSTDAGN